MSELLHYGVKRRSGRYPWGSGEDPQRSKDILSKIDDLKLKGLKEPEIAKELGMNTTELRNQIAWANNVRKQVLMESIKSRKERGDSNTKIAEELAIAESTVRNYLTQKEKNTIQQLDNVTDVLRNSIDEVEYLDIGIGVERQMGISRNKLKAAVSKLKEEGYVEHEIYVKRLNDPSKYTTITVLTKEPDLEVVKHNSDKIRPVEHWSEDGGMSFKKLEPIQMLDWERISIRYKEDGGEDKDGVIELRRNVKDLDLGASSYAQVRIGVNGSHYLKGMAMYTDDIPDGVDIVFNTNKKKGTPKDKVLKELKNNPDNPFGATIQRQEGKLNIVNEEGDWNKWSATLSAQFLSKQPTKLVKERMDATFDSLKKEYDELASLTNPVVKKHLMTAYADGLDAKARHLKAQGLPRTKSHVILPFPGMNPNEVYAPNYNDGDRVVLVRYPHGGIFELPELTVNNKGPAKNTLKNAIDAIGIHPSVAGKLSGADFDGDTVYVIPNNQKKIKTAPSLKALKNFDPVREYQVDHKTISPKSKQTQMGIVSNLITDMTIKGANPSELARAVRHSMVVIDSEKHNLDYKKSAADHAIGALQKKYQTHISPVTGKKSTSASTIVSRSKKYDRKSKTYLVDDIFDRDGNVDVLSSGTAVENVYTNYVNKVKTFSNKVKKETAEIPPIKRDKLAAKKYSEEVKSLDKKLNTALLNAPKERQAQLMASNTYYKNLKALNYEVDDDQKKKLRAQALAKARLTVEAKKKQVEITDTEWEAIQNGAISNNKLDLILKNADMDKVKQLAMPKQTTKMPTAKLTRASVLLDKGYTYAEVAASIGVNVSTLRSALNEE